MGINSSCYTCSLECVISPTNLPGPVSQTESFAPHQTLNEAFPNLGVCFVLNVIFPDPVVCLQIVLSGWFETDHLDGRKRTLMLVSVLFKSD